MKTCLLKIFVLIGLCLGLLVAPAGYSATRRSDKTGVWNGRRVTLKGSGNLVTRTKAAPDFRAVSAARGIEVVIGGSSKIVIEADDNVMDYVVAEVEGGTLQITLLEKVNVRNASITVRIPNNGKIEALRASSGAEIRTETALKASDLDIRLSSAASLDAALKVKRCSIRMSSGSEMKAAADFGQCTVGLSSGSSVRLSGKADALSADISSGAELKAGELDARVCKVEASSGAEAEVNCSGELTARASSGGSIKYKGDCEVDKQSSSGGEVRKR